MKKPPSKLMNVSLLVVGIHRGDRKGEKEYEF